MVAPHATSDAAAPRANFETSASRASFERVLRGRGGVGLGDTRPAVKGLASRIEIGHSDGGDGGSITVQKIEIERLFCISAENTSRFRCKIDDGEWILPKYMIKSPFLENVTLLEEYPCVRAQATRTYEASQLTFSARYRDHDLEKMLSLGHTRMLQHGTEEFMHLKVCSCPLPEYFLATIKGQPVVRARACARVHDPVFHLRRLQPQLNVIMALLVVLMSLTNNRLVVCLSSAIVLALYMAVVTRTTTDIFDSTLKIMLYFGKVLLCAPGCGDHMTNRYMIYPKLRVLVDPNHSIFRRAEPSCSYEEALATLKQKGVHIFFDPRTKTVSYRVGRVHDSVVTALPEEDFKYNVKCFAASGHPLIESIILTNFVLYCKDLMNTMDAVMHTRLALATMRKAGGTTVVFFKKWIFTDTACEVFALVCTLVAGLAGLVFKSIQAVTICTSFFWGVNLLWYIPLLLGRRKRDHVEWLMPKRMLAHTGATVLAEFNCTSGLTTRTYNGISFSAPYDRNDLEEMMRLGSGRFLNQPPEEFLADKIFSDESRESFLLGVTDAKEPMVKARASVMVHGSVYRLRQQGSLLSAISGMLLVAIAWVNTKLAVIVCAGIMVACYSAVYKGIGQKGFQKGLELVRCLLKVLFNEGGCCDHITNRYWMYPKVHVLVDPLNSICPTTEPTCNFQRAQGELRAWNIDIEFDRTARTVTYKINGVSRQVPTTLTVQQFEYNVRCFATSGHPLIDGKVLSDRVLHCHSLEKTMDAVASKSLCVGIAKWVVLGGKPESHISGIGPKGTSNDDDDHDDHVIAVNL
ncbi:hypothetical protein CBR_g50786 [Chara braunii]|uniref:Uncharacterized protein n=1 Tax=Chara braunii TaxID=69332 RepID=A0A388K5Y3_CHABU|nr:hypothetical protein CBR_g50786 [Chara braunii]|eukprot:GBG65426.1 hypothetical protein CBR_g50786 [Chara braunii]